MKEIERVEARKLRQLGYSINDICRILKVAKSSVSLWVRDIELTVDQIQKLDQKISQSREKFSYLSRCRGANTNKADAEQRHILYEKAGHQKARLDEKFRIICALYWGEGYKRSQNTFGVANCDPALLRLILNWLVDAGFDEQVRFSVQYYGENGLGEDFIKSWWMAQLPNLKPKHLRKFTRCAINRASQQKKIGKQPYGTATIQVCSTELFFNVMG